MSIENYVTSGSQNGQTVMLDLWGVVLDQQKAGGVMIDAYKMQAEREHVPEQDISQIVSDYSKVLSNDKSVADRKVEIVDTLQDLAEKYIEEHIQENPEIRENLESSIYDDCKDLMDRLAGEGYNIAVFTTRPAEWIRDYLEVEIGNIYDAKDGKTPERFREICDEERRNGRNVVSFVEDALKALVAAVKSGELSEDSVVYINREGVVTKQESDEAGVKVHVSDLMDAYKEIACQQENNEDCEEDERNGKGGEENE